VSSVNLRGKENVKGMKIVTIKLFDLQSESVDVQFWQTEKHGQQSL
jgi:hypothetical protein